MLAAASGSTIGWMATTANPPRKTIRISDFYVPLPKQAILHSLPAKHRLAVGGFGSAKSRALLMEALFHCLEYPGSNSMILRKTIPDLKRTVIDKWEVDVPKELYEYGSQEKGMFNKTDHIVYFPPVNGKQSKLYFGACERIEDVGKYLSTEFVFVGFEELGEFPYMIYDAMEGRNRCTLPGARPCMVSVTNPRGIGWGWIKRMWIDHLPVRGMDPEKYNPDDYQYVHSTVDDNPYLRDDRAYVASLEKSPLRDKIRWGKLDTISGQYFANFEEARHVRPKDHFIFHSWNPVWIAIDYGFGHYAAITYWTKANLKPEYTIDGKPKLVNVTIKELVLHEATPKQQCEALIAAIPRAFDKEGHDEGFAWDIDSIHLSWERFNRTVENRTVADEMGDYLQNAGLPRPTRSNNDRVAGWMKMYEMLEMDEWFLLRDECRASVEAIPLAVRGDGIKVSMEDVVKPKGLSMEDDILDSLRYAVAGVLLDEGQKPKEQLLREKLAGIKDPFARSAYAYKQWNTEQAKERQPLREKVIPSWQRRVKP